MRRRPANYTTNAAGKRVCWKTCPCCGREHQTSFFRGVALCPECYHAHDEPPKKSGVVPLGMWHRETTSEDEQ